MGRAGTPGGRAPRRRPPRWRRVVRQLAVVAATFVALEALLALLGVAPLLESEDPFVGYAGSLPLFEERAAADGTRLRVTSPGKLRWFNEQSFAVPKPAGAVRIFTLGGSTTYGHPYDDAVSYSGWLRELLPAADPSQAWEVVNCGGISYASYREVVLMQELVAYEPDLFIVYAGPNEFLEQRTYASLERTEPWLVELGGLLARTRLFTVARRLVRGAADGHEDEAGDGRAVLPAEVRTRLDEPAGLDLYERDDPLRDAILLHYRRNLERMTELAASAGARIVLVTTASQLRDCTPFKSQHGEDLEPGQARFVEQLTGEVARLLARPADALVPASLEETELLARRATDLDPRHALAWYRLGQVQFARGLHEQALEAFRRARDEDVCPLRPLTVMRDIVREVGRVRRVPVLDFVELVADECERRFGHRIPGAEQFLDHVHLDIDGYRLLALELLRLLRAEGLVQVGPGWGEPALAAVDARVRSRLDRRAQGLQLRNLAKTLGWAGKYEEAERLARQTLEVLGPGDAETHFLLGNFAAQAGRSPEALEHYLRAVAIDPGYAEAHHNLADVALKLDRVELAREHLQAALALNPAQPQAASVLAMLLDREGRGEEAMALLDQALQLAPEDARIHLNRGLVLARSGRDEEALASVLRSLRLDPAYAKAHYNAALLLLRADRSAEAVAHLRRALEIDPGYQEARTALEAAAGAGRP